MHNLKLNLLVEDYLKKTYGKDYKNRNISINSIGNAFISGFQACLDTSKDIAVIYVPFSRKYEIEAQIKTFVDKFSIDDNTLFGIKILALKDMPNDVISMVGSDGDVVSVINIGNKKFNIK